jgi:hypothetical protein
MRSPFSRQRTWYFEYRWRTDPVRHACRSAFFRFAIILRCPPPEEWGQNGASIKRNRHNVL